MDNLMDKIETSNEFKMGVMHTLLMLTRFSAHEISKLSDEINKLEPVGIENLKIAMRLQGKADGIGLLIDWARQWMPTGEVLDGQ